MNQKGENTAEYSQSIVMDFMKEDDELKEDEKEEEPNDFHVQINPLFPDSFTSFTTNRMLLGSKKNIKMTVTPDLDISSQSQCKKLNEDDLEEDQNVEENQVGRSPRDESQNKSKVNDQNMNEDSKNNITHKTKTKVIEQFIIRFKWVISIIAAIIILTGIGVGVGSHFSGRKEPENQQFQGITVSFNKTNKAYTADYVKKGNITYLTIKDTPLVVDPITNKIIILFPITKDMFFSAINNPLLTELPMSFELNEVANYTATVKSTTESDVMAPQKEQVINFNISFYTLQITPDHYQIVTQYQMTGNNNDQLPTAQPPSQNSSQQAMISNADSMFSGGSSQKVKPKIEDMETGSDQDKMAFLKQMIKISICNVTREGIIAECDFQNGMSFADKSLAVKFLKLYVPDLKKSLYQNQKGKLRFLQELAPTVPENGEAQYSISSPNSSVFGMQSSKSQSQDNFMGSQSTYTSSCEVDLEKGKASDVKKDESLSMMPTKTEGSFQKNETTIKSMGQQSNVFIKFVSQAVSTDEEIQQKSQFLSLFKDFDTIKDPYSFFNNRTLTTQPIDLSGMDNGTNLRRLLSKGRDLVSKKSPYIEIAKEIGRMNLVFTTLIGGFEFACTNNTDNTKDDQCTAGLYIDAKPLDRMHPIRATVSSSIGKTVRELRYYKMVFQKNVDLFYNLTESINAIIEDLVFGNLATFDDSFQTLLTPMIDAENAIGNYTKSVLSKTVQGKKSIEFSKTLSEVIDQYTSRNLESFIGKAKSQINFLTKSYASQIEKFADEIFKMDATFKSSVIDLVENQRDQILGVYDQTLDQFDLSISSFNTDMMNKFDFVSLKVQSVSESKEITDFGYSDIINSIQNSVKGLYTELLQPFQPINGAYSELKYNSRVIIHLYHTEMRETLTEQFNGIIDIIKEQAGNAELSLNQIQLLDVSYFTSIAQKISFVSVIVDITENTDDLFSYLQGIILSDILAAGEIIKIFANCANEKEFFDTTFTQLNKDIEALSLTLPLKIGKEIIDTIKNASENFEFVRQDIAAIPGNIITLFSKPVNLNLPIGKINLNDEINEIEALIKKIEDLMDKFTELTQLTEKIDIKINSIYTKASNIRQLPNRINAKFTDALQKIKTTGDSIQQSFKLPLNGFKYTSVNFDTLHQAQITQIRTEVEVYGKLKLKDLAKQFGGTFLVTLTNILDRKIAAIMPSGKKILYEKKYNKDITIFRANVPLPVGSIYTEIFQSFEASVDIFIEFKAGKLQIVVDPKAKFIFGMRVAWDLVIAKTGISTTGTVFQGSIYTVAGVQISLSKPSLFFSSQLQLSVLTLSFSLVVQYLEVSVGYDCWSVWGFRICIPYITVKWSSWKVITSYNKVFGTVITYSIIDAKLDLDLI